jgi:hypothetical protein
MLSIRSQDGGFQDVIDAGDCVRTDGGRGGPWKLGDGPGGGNEGVDRLTSALGPKGCGLLDIGEYACLKWPWTVLWTHS